jgi:hypothetical protein
VADNYIAGETAQENQDSGAEKILEEAKARLKLAEQSESEIRRLALEDLEFSSGKQWPDEVKSERERDGRPCLVINRIPQFIQQVTNDQRQNRPSIKVHAVDDSADDDTAKVIQGLIRHIEYNSSADTAYDTAFDSAVRGGFGYFRIVTDFVSPTSFEQEILIKRIRNPFSVFFDPFSQEPDGSDASFAFVIEELTKDEFRTRYPESKLCSEDEWSLTGNQSPEWVKTDGARVAEYFFKDHREAELCLLSDGQVMEREEAEQAVAGSVMIDELGQAVAGLEIVQTRKSRIPVIRWVKLSGAEILEETEWPGIYIPIIPVYGAEQFINGKRMLEGLVRNAKDSQRMYNYWASAETEAIALAPRAPFLVAEGQIEGYENEWETANRRNHAFLTYRVKSVGGEPLPPPQRNAFEPAVQAITQARMIAADDLKATTGIYDAALGNKSNETSGIAIRARNVQAQTSNFHFIDNLTRSLRHAGRILVDLIPRIYDTARSARIIGDDGEQKVVKLNQPTGEVGKDGQELIYSLDAGKYDVTVDVGPSYASKRQEAVASMMEVTRAVPQLMQVAGDLFIKAMDWPGASEISERLKKTLPPNLIEDPNQKKVPIPPQVQAQMQQMGQMVDQLTEKLNEAQDQLDHKRLELESKERIEMKKLEVQLEIKRAELDAKDSLALLNAEIAQIGERLQLLKMEAPIEDLTPPSQPNFDEMPITADGAYEGAEFGDGGLDPTGGASPGLPMEGISSDDPSAPV